MNQADTWNLFTREIWRELGIFLALVLFLLVCIWLPFWIDRIRERRRFKARVGEVTRPIPNAPPPNVTWNGRPWSGKPWRCK